MRFKTEYLKPFPVKVIDFNKSDEKKLHDEMVKVVSQLLDYNKELQNVNLETQKEQLQNRISYCEDRINAIVYDLYGVTEEEIKIVESK